MRILKVFDLFCPPGGGTPVVIYNLSRALAQREHEVVIYTSDFKLDQEYIDSLQGIKVYPFHCWSNLAQFYLTPGMVGEVRRKLKDFDIIHMQCFRSFQNIVIHHYARKYNIPYILDAHGSLPRKYKRLEAKSLLKWLFDVAFGYRILRDASLVIAETEMGVNDYKQLGVNQDKIVMFPTPFDTEEFSQLPPPGLFKQKYNIKEKHIIMFLGRIHWIKGIDFLVESFYQLAQYRHDVILAIVGNDDGYKSTLDRLIDKLGLSDRVLFTGFLGGKEKLSALVDASVAVLPSIYEAGASWALIEAILCNTPIIVSSNSGSGEDVKKIDAGYLVEYGNKSELRDTMQNILDNPPEAQKKTQKAKEYIKANLSLEKGVEKYEKLYDEVLGRCKK